MQRGERSSHTGVTGLVFMDRVRFPKAYFLPLDGQGVDLLVEFG